MFFGNILGGSRAGDGRYGRGFPRPGRARHLRRGELRPGQHHRGLRAQDREDGPGRPAGRVVHLHHARARGERVVVETFSGFLKYLLPLPGRLQDHRDRRGDAEDGAVGAAGGSADGGRTAQEAAGQLD